MASETPARGYKSYDYKQAVAPEEWASFYIDCCACFGWTPDGNRPPVSERGQSLLSFKRDRNIASRAELTRLERGFEACLRDLETMERSKTSRPTGRALACGLAGTVFMAGSVFAVTASPPVVWLCALLAVPGFLGWALALPVYRRGVAKRTAALAPFIAAKREEIDSICRKGCALL